MSAKADNSEPKRYLGWVFNLILFIYFTAYRFCLLIKICLWLNFSESDWHMIIAGRERSSVELFNWRTKQQCILNEDFSGVNVMGSLGSWMVKALAMLNCYRTLKISKHLFFISDGGAKARVIQVMFFQASLMFVDNTGECLRSDLHKVLHKSLLLPYSHLLDHPSGSLKELHSKGRNQTLLVRIYSEGSCWR